MDTLLWGTGVLVGTTLGLAALWARLSGKPNPGLASVLGYLSFCSLTTVALLWLFRLTSGLPRLVIGFLIAGIWLVALIEKIASRRLRARQGAEHRKIEHRLAAVERAQLMNLKQYVGQLSEKLRAGRQISETDVAVIKTAWHGIDELVARLAYFAAVSGAAREFIQAETAFLPHETGAETVESLVDHRPRFESVDERRKAQEWADSARNRVFAAADELLRGE